MTEPNKDTKEKQSNISNHAKCEFDDFILDGLKSGGCHIVASKSHGKSRLMFSIFQKLQKQDNVRAIAFDGSETWIYSASKIETFTISEKDIITNDVKTTDEMESYQLQNWNLVKLALDTNKDILFRLKTRKPSKRGFFVRTVVNYLDSLQRDEKQKNANHENTKSIAYFIEEAQDCFSSRSSARLEMEEFLTVFNEGRNNKESFWTASQRLTDFSKTIRSKQLQCIGKLSSEDITPSLRRIEKKLSLDFSNMPQKTWYFEGKTFVSPEFKQYGKPYQINDQVKFQWMQSLPKKMTLKERIMNWLAPKPQPKKQIVIQQTTDNKQEQLSEEDKESYDNGYIDNDEEEDSDLIEFGL